MPKNFEETARLNAQKLWNETPCGVVEGHVLDLDYFLRAEAHRYQTSDKWLIKALPFTGFSGRKVLEIGVGQGTDLAQFAKNGAICHGADITDEHLHRTAENFKARGYGVELKKCDAIDIAFPDNFFDFVYSIGVIHHIPEKERVFREINRILKPGGLFLGAVYRKWSAFHLFQKLLCDGLLSRNLFRLGYKGLLATVEQGADGIHIKPFVELYTKKSLSRACQSAGLKVLRTRVLHLERSHFGCFCRALGWIKISWLEPILGWYLLAEATKDGHQDISGYLHK